MRSAALPAASPRAQMARVVGDRAAARVSRGAGRPILARLPYPVEEAVAMLAGARHVVLVGAKDPVGFFRLPG